MGISAVGVLIGSALDLHGEVRLSPAVEEVGSNGLGNMTVPNF